MCIIINIISVLADAVFLLTGPVSSSFSMLFLSPMLKSFRQINEIRRNQVFQLFDVISFKMSNIV